MTNTLRRALSVALMLPLGIGIPAMFTGCEREIIDVETPEGSLEVNEKMDGSIEVETKDAD